MCLIVTVQVCVFKLRQGRTFLFCLCDLLLSVVVGCRPSLAGITLPCTGNTFDIHKMVSKIISDKHSSSPKRVAYTPWSLCSKSGHSLTFVFSCLAIIFFLEWYNCSVQIWVYPKSRLCSHPRSFYLKSRSQVEVFWTYFIVFMYWRFSLIF